MTKIIDIEIYETDVMVCVGGADELRAELGIYDIAQEEKEHIVSEAESSVAVTSMLQCGSVVMAFQPGLSREYFIGAVAHEAFHAACMIMEKIGVSFTGYHDEAYAYLIQLLTKKICEKFNLFEEEQNPLTTYNDKK